MAIDEDKIYNDIARIYGTVTDRVVEKITKYVVGLLEEHAAQQSFAPDVCDARFENHEWVRRDGIEICLHCKRPRR